MPPCILEGRFTDLARVNGSSSCVLHIGLTICCCFFFFLGWGGGGLGVSGLGFSGATCHVMMRRMSCFVLGEPKGCCQHGTRLEFWSEEVLKQGQVPASRFGI